MTTRKNKKNATHDYHELSLGLSTTSVNVELKTFSLTVYFSTRNRRRQCVE